MAFFTSDDLRSNFEATIGNLNQKLINCKRIFYKNSKQALLYPIESYQKIPPILLFRPIRLLIFSKKVPPILLFPPIFSLIFKEISHLYFYSEPSSIRNSRVCASFYVHCALHCIALTLISTT